MADPDSDECIAAKKFGFAAQTPMVRDHTVFLVGSEFLGCECTCAFGTIKQLLGDDVSDVARGAFAFH